MGASADTLNQVEAKSLKTLSGKALSEGTEEERADAAFEKDFIASGYNNPTHTPEQREQAKLDFQARRDSDNAWAATSRKYELEKLQAGSDKIARDRAERKIEEHNREAINNLLVSQPTLVNNELSTIEINYNKAINQGVPEAEAMSAYKQDIEAYFNGQEAQIRRIAQESKDGLPVQKDAALSNLAAMKTTALKYVGTTEYNKELGLIKTRLEAETDLAIINSSRSAFVASRVLNMAGPAAIHLQELTTSQMTDLNYVYVDMATRQDGDPPPRILEGTAEAEALDAVLGENLSRMDEVGDNGEFVVSREGLRSQVTGVLAYTADALGRADGKTANLVINRLTDPNLGEFIKQEKLTGEDISNAQLALTEYKEDAADNFNTFLTDRLAAIGNRSTLASTGPRGRLAASRVPELSDFELVFQSDQVLMKGKTPEARRAAQELNRQVSGPLTKIVQADAHLSGESYSSVFNAWAPELWPEQQEETVTEE